MLWKSRCSLWTASNQIIRILPLPSLSLGYHSSPFQPETCRGNYFSRENSSPDFPYRSKLLLTSQLVYSTLSNCPSDLIALGIFIWCAQQHNYFHDAAAFDCMVGRVRRLSEQCKTVKGIILELQNIGCVTKAKIFLLLLRIYWRAGMHAMVFEAFEQMESYGFEPNTLARNVVMDVLFKIGRPNFALKVWKETQSPNFLTFSIVLLHLCKLNDISHIKPVVKVMLKMGYHPNPETFEMLLNCYCKMNRLFEASQVLGLMTVLGIPMSVSLWTILIHGFCKLGKLGVASNMLQKMGETGCSPSVVTYTTLIKAFMESGMVTDAFRFLKIMQSSGLNPDLVLSNVLIDCLTKVGRYQNALEVFVNLFKQNIAPDIYTFSSLLSTICYSGRFSLLPELVDGLSIEADLVLYNALLSCFCKAGLPYLAVELYNDMIDKGFTPDKYSFAGLLSGLCAARRIDEAINVYYGISLIYPGTDAHIHTVIIDRLIKVGEHHKAVRVFRKAMMEKFPLDVVSYTVGIHGLLRGGRIQEACTMFDQMKENGLRPNAHTCNMMLSMFCKEKDLKMVKQMLQEMIDLRIVMTEKSFFNLCKYLCRSITYRSAISLLVEMKDLGLLPDKVACKLYLGGHTEDVYVDYEYCMESCTEFDLTLHLSSSDELSDVAAAVC